tara:strand:- start:310 stop:570 length:261 start_codon:yes stop_codon:yes gene_type:complete
MAEKPILITPEGKKIMTLSAAKAYYESKRNKPKSKGKVRTKPKGGKVPKTIQNLPAFPKRKNTPKLPKRIPAGMSGYKRAKPARRK